MILLFSMIAATQYSGSIIHLPIIRKDNPSPAPNGVHILPNYTDYTNSVNDLHIVGEVQNNTANTLQFIFITADIFNASGQLLKKDYTYPLLNNLPPGQKACFNLSLKAPAGWSGYSFEDLQYDPNGVPVSGLSLSNISRSYNPTDGSFQITGQVQNTSARPIRYVRPIGTLYNSAGQVIGCGFYFANPQDLSPAETGAFKLTFTGRNYWDTAHYELQVDGSPQ